MKTNILKALADPTRLKILLLLERGEVCACKIPKKVFKTQPAVSQHLKILKEARLLQMRKDGKNRIYSSTKKARKILENIRAW